MYARANKDQTYSLPVHEQDYDTALKDYVRACELAPNNAKFWYTRGNMQLEMCRFEDAHDSYTRALILEPEGQYCSVHNINSIDIWRA